MYWLIPESGAGWINLFILFAVISTGGWLIAVSAFRLYGRERLIVGLGIGIVGFVFCANVIGQIIPPEFSFWLAALIVLLIGVAFWLLQENRKLEFGDFNAWPLVLTFLAIAVVIILMGRGLAIFDDRKNLSIISTMAAGDIPPHFYMNPDYLFNYHYGFQLLGAGMMRVAGMYPWSAFDLSKGLVSALAIVLAVLWGWRATLSKGWGVLTGALITFASGSRWLLNFLPQSILRGVSEQVELWGASGSTVASLYEGLAQSWTIDGGPPLALPFAYVNGILQPFILKLHKGPIGLSLAILFLLLLLIGKSRGWKGALVLTVLFAAWGLIAEAEFLLFGLGLFIVTLWVMFREGSQKTIRRLDPGKTILALLAGGIISLLQGGTITEMVKGIIGLRSAADLGGGTGVGGFQLRWPPAIVSAHLGELRLSSFEQMLVGIVELGPAIMAGILILFFVPRLLERRRIPEATLALASYAGFLVPIFLRYDVDRDITRMSAFALMGWIILSVPILAILWRRYKAHWVRKVIGSWGAVLVFGGLVVTGSLLSAVPRATFSYHIADLDVHMTQRVWDQLPQHALVMSAHEWRVVPVTGRLTRTSADNTTVLQSWRHDVDSATTIDLARAGFDYVYVDEVWWQAMTDEIRDSYSEDCVTLVAEVEDTSKTHFRRLYEVSGCME